MSTQKILVVDDDEIVLKLLAHDLGGAGYEVLQASTGEKALRLARTEQPDLIVLDILMPDMDGGEIGQKLGDSPETSHIPIVYLTSLLPKHEGDGRSRGRHVCVAKPYERDELLEVIAAEL